VRYGHTWAFTVYLVLSDVPNGALEIATPCWRRLWRISINFVKCAVIVKRLPQPLPLMRTYPQHLLGKGIVVK
jgi:hypothetical protein